ncbi:glutamate/gamma-aminobutyrate family transporter YjeM [Companilactobacillus allii]|uniref:Glutamate/gamma-aminobutyrate family transporter YjeM n=1 Tax=Companilactobacillus allii TaxID=1847728 RepID=A0A1P8Q5N3_9LACO|nr:glutamate/gamma-aminobutyrate family transporter YjeM [Companilactobacillus allii]APX73155.1 glutamate/gamma-aminobutyrate family transporter YjeM [Companilactobacillus allii]USQ67961.1 glutamate/gamma-aminobutyrate family transporter YjeM [Companilactobacillus allii]
MDDGNSTKKTITLFGLIMMIFTAIFGFANTTVAYEQMGLASIIWYVFAAVFFFLPAGFMMAEYGSAFNEAKGGIYSWIEGAVGPKIAFTGTFIWLASWEVWLVSTSTKVWIPLSTFFVGHDGTQSWGMFGLSATQVIGILGLLWIMFVTFFASLGMDKISKVSSVGGILTIALNGIFFLLSLILLFTSGFHSAEPITGLDTFIHSANPAFASPIGMISFVVYAIFAYGGMESVGAVTDSMKHPKRDFPRGVLISAGVIAVTYSLTILMWGISTNWNQILGKSNVNLGNITYVMMSNLGYQFADSIGWSHAAAITTGEWLARFTGFDMFILYMGSFFVLVYSPLKSFIMGTPKDFWPERVTKLNKHGMPANAMWMQAGFVGIMILLIAFGGRNAKQLYNVLTLMANVSTTIPYLFLVGAYPFFNINDKIEKPYLFYKNRKAMWAVSIVSFVVLALAVIFTVIQPIIEHAYSDAFWTVIGPIVFGAIALILYGNYDRKQKAKKAKDSVLD